MMNKISVITRTLNRPRMLQRAFESIRAQTMKGLQWVIVNDGGEHAPVECIADQAAGAGINVSLIHHESRRGMEAASNTGVRGSESEYVAIHDDDDTWQPDFAAVVAATLDMRPDVVGAVARAMTIRERMMGEQIVVVSRRPHRPELKAIHLADMLRTNLFPPISFMYRRSLFERLAGYDESMSVLGDWDFNLRALLVGNIALVDQLLSNYHLRTRVNGEDAGYLNSVVINLSDHHEMDAAFRNYHIRQDVTKGRIGLGTFLALARLHHQPRKRLGTRWAQLFANAFAKHGYQD